MENTFVLCPLLGSHQSTLTDWAFDAKTHLNNIYKFSLYFKREHNTSPL
jgi:hypothetical protein